MATDSPLPQAIQKLLQQKQFTQQVALKNTAHIVLKGRLPGQSQTLLFKAHKGGARNSLQQRNHILWTTSLQANLPAEAPFAIAPILESGCEDEQWFWFISPFIEGTSFATELHDRQLTKLNVSKQQLPIILPRIVALMQYISHAPALSVNGTDARYAGPVKKNKLSLLERAIRWARSDTPFLAELLQLITANYQYLRLANAHGDFTENNLILTPQNKPVLIDAELGDAYNFAHYDAVEFYNRLYSRANAPEVAAEFLRLYAAAIPQSGRQRFMSNFLCLSALRCIGDFMEIKQLDDSPAARTRWALTRQYAELLVNYQILLPVQANR